MISNLLYVLRKRPHTFVYGLWCAAVCWGVVFVLAALFHYHVVLPREAALAACAAGYEQDSFMCLTTSLIEVFMPFITAALVVTLVSRILIAVMEGFE